MAIGTSYWSEGAGTTFPPPPVILSEVPAITYREMVTLEGTKRADCEIVINGAAVPEFCYTEPTRWLYGVPLAVGMNTFNIKARGFDGRESAATVVSASRVARTGDYAVSFRLMRNGVQVNAKVADISISASPMFIAGRLGFKFFERGAFVYGDRVELFHTDVLIGEVRVFAGNVITVREAGRYPLISFDAEVLDDGERVVGATFTGSVAGTTNGAIVRYLLRRAGVAAENIVVPDGQRYTGPRSINDKGIWETIREIQKVEGWSFRVTPAGVLRFEPDIALYFHSWEFTDADVLEYTQEENRLAYCNALRVVYIEQEDSLKGGAQALQDDQIPDKTGEGEGFGFFTGFDYQEQVEAQSVNSDVFFAVWTDKVDLTALSKSLLYLRYADSAAKISTFTQDIALRAFPDKHILVGTFDLSKYKLSTNAPFAFSFAVQDVRGNYFAQTRTPFTLTDEAAQEQRIMTAYGIQLTGMQEVGVVDLTFPISTEGDLPGENAEAGIIAAKSRQNQPKRKSDGEEDENPSWSGEFVVEVFVDDAISSSIETNLATPAVGVLADDPGVILTNCVLRARDDAPYNIKAQVLGIRYHSPRSPLRRVDSLFFLFGYSGVRAGDVIRCKFSVRGQRIVSTGEYIDPTMIRLYMEDPAEIELRGLVFGGTLASGYFTTKAQAANLGAKTLRNHSSAPIQRFTATVPFLAEMRAMSAIRWTSAARQETTLLLVSDVAISNDGKTMALEGYRYEQMLEFHQNTVGAKVIGISRPDMRNDLLEVFDDAARTRGLMRGTVRGRKYAGMYHVELDNPAVTLDNVKSQIEELADGEAVLLGDYPGGGYIIVMRLDGDFFDVEDPVDEEELEKNKDDYLTVPLEDDPREGDRYDKDKDKPAFPDLTCTLEISDMFDGLVAITSELVLKFSHEVMIEGGSETFSFPSAPRQSDRIADNFVRILDADFRQVYAQLEYTTATEKLINGVKTKVWDRTGVRLKRTTPFKTSVKYQLVVENRGNRPGGISPQRVWNHGSFMQFESCDGKSAKLPDSGIKFEFTTEPLFRVERVQHANPIELLLTLSQNVNEGVEGLFEPLDAWELIETDN